MYAPIAIAEDTVESLWAQHGPERRGIYWLVLVGVIGAIVSLPFIPVDVTVRAPGLVRSRGDRTELRAAVSGRVLEVPVHDNEPVTAGQPLLVVAAGELDEQMRRLSAQVAEKALLLADFATLMQGDDPGPALQVEICRRERTQFQAQLDAFRLAATKAGGELARYAALAEKGIATRQELDNARYEVERLQAEARLFREQTLARWAARWREEQSAQDELVSGLRRLEEQRIQYVVRAPAAGVLVGFNGWNSGAQLLAGQLLGALSPGDALQVESQVSTRDIGHVRVGQGVRLQVDAFPYTQWGALEGRVESIGADLVPGGAGGPVGYFKVLIRPLATHLALPNGRRAELKKGLTLGVRYVVARRSLLQVLYDDASAWFDPRGDRRAGPPDHP
ncbi:MAG TPA: HlyD family efflux transporter periplasmic adaptor subunit [Lacunisphaera sp.]|nr:HlyD family efflux transporter periplasmic adaptor subunit [Lacunisphaera sp.]